MAAGPDLIEARFRLRSKLSDADWRAVRSAVHRGEAAPARLRSAAHELASELAHAHDTARWPPRRAVAILVAVVVYVGYTVAWSLKGGFGWSDLMQALPLAALTFSIPWAAGRERARIHAAVAANG